MCPNDPAYQTAMLAFHALQRYLRETPTAPHGVLPLVFCCCLCDLWHVGFQEDLPHTRKRVCPHPLIRVPRFC